MAIFQRGVKVGKFDVRTGLTKQRGQGILRKLGILEDKHKEQQRAMGEVDTIRSLIGMAEGFLSPANFKIQFEHPTGIQQPTRTEGPPGPPGGGFGAPYTKGERSGATVKGGGLDWKTHQMNRSTSSQIKQLFDDANPVADTKYIKGAEGLKPEEVAGLRRANRKMDIFCSKVSIPEKTINIGQYRHYGEPFPFPQSVQYGTLTTTFYCDAVMTIKRFFDGWQKLILNDMTGNFNYYDEYVSQLKIFTRSTISASAPPAPVVEKAKDEFPNNLSNMIKDATKAFNDLTGVPNKKDAMDGAGKVPVTKFSETYGVKVFNCWPQIVGSVDLAHDATDQIGTFDVTWAYTKWSPFKMGEIGNRDAGEVNLSIGEFRNEKDGFPFLEDLPPELSGPLTGALGQAVTTGPLSNLSNLVG